MAKKAGVSPGTSYAERNVMAQASFSTGSRSHLLPAEAGISVIKRSAKPGRFPLSRE